jgi:hypothetical protein
MIVRFENAYGRIDEYPELRVLRYTRNDVLFPTLADLERVFAETSRELDRLGRERHAMLVDLRAAHGSNAPGFEEAMARARRGLLAGFPRIAVLVKTAAGALQMQRHAREDGANMRVFQDEAEALAFAGESLERGADRWRG